jgi:hypothetical protein
MDLVFDLASLEAARNNSYVFAVLDDHVLQTAT